MGVNEASNAFETEFFDLISKATIESLKNIVIEKVENATVMRMGEPIKPIVMYKATGIFKKDMIAEFLTNIKKQIPENEYEFGYETMTIMSLPKAPIVPAIIFVYLMPAK